MKEINPWDYKGGIGVWASFRPVFTNRDRRKVSEPTFGVHIHARKEQGSYKCIDYTFDNVVLDLTQYNLGKVSVSKNVMLSYFIAENLGHKLKPLYCPYCKCEHIDEGYFAVKPHAHHLCMNCGKEFFDTEKAISNPLSQVRKAVLSKISEPPTKIVNRLITIDKNEYLGGIELYGTHKALLWTSPIPQESGIHVHCYASGGLKRVVDDTYGVVYLNETLLDLTETQLLQAQLVSKYLKKYVKSVYCPKCDTPQKSFGKDRYIPRRDFTCYNCGEIFYEERECISNSMYAPLVTAL